ncbi:MAG: S8 family serine peptidase [Bdellovibrionia bacterium]
MEETKFHRNYKESFGNYYKYNELARQMACDRGPTHVLSNEELSDKFKKISGESVKITKSFYTAPSKEEGQFFEVEELEMSGPGSNNTRILVKTEMNREYRISRHIIEVQRPCLTTFCSKSEYNANCKFLGAEIFDFNKDSFLKSKRWINEEGKTERIVYAERKVFPLKKIYRSGNPLTADLHRERLKIAKRDDRVIVTLLDSGVDYNHPGIAYKVSRASKTTLKGYDYVTGDHKPYDQNVIVNDINNHGTHVAGIAARGSDDIEILPFRWEGDLSQLEKALEASYKFGSRLVNLSIAQTNPDIGAKFSQLIPKYKDVLFIAAAGNDRQELGVFSVFPARLKFPNLLIVAAVNDQGHLWEHKEKGSNWSKEFVHIAAPGVKIFSLLPEGDFGQKTGTSMAAPFVTNIAAKMKIIMPSITPEQTIEILENSIVKNSSLEGKIMFAGIANEEAALNLTRKLLQQAEPTK